MFIKNFNYQAVISYLGTFRFIFIFLDIFIFNIFFIDILKDFVIYYTLLIFSFIGAMRWSFSKNLNFISTIFGFMPSFLATFIVIVNLLQSNKFFIFLFISICFIMQLIVDFLFYKKNHNEKIFFFRVRLPITIILIINISYLTFV